MTSLFLEYEKQREREEFNKSLIGKKFYWTVSAESNTLKNNIFTITGFLPCSHIQEPIAMYRYDYGSNFYDGSHDHLIYILKHATEYDPANFPAGHLD